MGHKIGYARVSTAGQNLQAQLDALAAAGCLKVYTDHASGTRAGRPRWQQCLADLRPGDTLIIWKIDRLGRSLRDLIDIVTTLRQREVGVRSLTNGMVDKAQRMYDSKSFTMSEIAQSCGVTPMTVYRNIRVDTATASSPPRAEEYGQPCRRLRTLTAGKPTGVGQDTDGCSWR